MTDHQKIQEMVRLRDQAPLTIDRPRSALLIIDAQRYFARRDYPFGQVVDKLVPGAADGYFKRVSATVLPNIRRLQECFRSRHFDVVSNTSSAHYGFYTSDCLSRPNDHPERHQPHRHHARAL